MPDPDNVQPQVPPQQPQQPQPTPPQPVVSAPSPSTSPSVVQPAQTSGTVSSPQPVVISDSNGPVVQPAGFQPPKSKKKWWLIGTGIVLALLISGGYVFGIYLPKTPSHVYNDSLVNTGKAIDQLIAYSEQQEQKQYKSTSFDGSLNVKSGSGSYDVSLSGEGSKSAATVQAKVDLLGENVTANVRAVPVSGDVTPDVYLQVNGAASLLGNIGLGSLNGQWIMIDHTLIDTEARAIKQQAGSSGSSSGTIDGIPTQAEVQDAIVKVQAVNKQYIFTTDSSKAVLANHKYVGKTTENGRTLDEYTVGYNKAHLTSYVTAVGAALDSSKLNAWCQQANKGKNLSQELNLSQLESTVTKSKGTYAFKLWADPATKLVSKLMFTDPSDSSSSFTLAQNYTGGNKYPFSLGFTGKENGTAETANLGLTLDKTTGKSNVTLSASSGTTNVSGNFTITPGNQTVTVTAPKGAKSLDSVLQSLGLGNSSALFPTKSTTSTLDPGGPLIPSLTQ